MKSWMNIHGLSVLLAVLVVMALAMTVSAAWHWHRAGDLRYRTEQLAGTAPTVEINAEQSDTDGDEPRKQDDDPAAAAARRIDERHLFVPAPPPQFRNVIGVLGNQALYAGGEALNIGQEKDGARLKAVGSSWVEFEFEGKTERINVLGEHGGGPGGPGDFGGGPPMMGGFRGGSRGGFGGGSRPPMDESQREQMREMFMRARESMTPEQQEEMRRRIEEFRSRRNGDGNRN
ncbi:MAG: hypothetical protein IT445_14080 [Phycisphaeraceae bacterium]|nr:hypothetical protein [Phycisphaeraceae bacterium]